MKAADILNNFPPFGGLDMEALDMRRGRLAPLEACEFGPQKVGWGVIFGSATADAIREAIKGLGTLRGAARGFLPLDTPEADETVKKYLSRYGQEPGMPVDPECFPYYVLIVASPRDISYAFEVELGLQNGVGRLWLGERPQPYADYVARMVRVGNPTRVADDLVRVSWLLPVGDDPQILTARRHLVSPLQTRVQGAAGAVVEWSEPNDCAVPDPNPGLWWSCSHGAELPYERGECGRRQHLRARLQGALAGSSRDADLRHLEEISARLVSFGEPDRSPFADGALWAFACHSAGTTRIDPIAKAHGEDSCQADSDFNSSLGCNCLACARFFVGSVNRVTAISYLNEDWKGYSTHFLSMIISLQRGIPVGYAREHALSGAWARTLFDLEDARTAGDLKGVLRLYRKYHDLSMIVVAGDPAAFLGKSDI